jgi:hypothetical protein
MKANPNTPQFCVVIGLTVIMLFGFFGHGACPGEPSGVRQSKCVRARANVCNRSRLIPNAR